MADIFGTTENIGLGSNRKSSTPTFRSSVSGLDTGSRRSGVSISAGRINLSAAGSVRAPQIVARSSNPFLKATKQANGPLVSDRAFAQGMGDIAQGLVTYTDKLVDEEARTVLLNHRKRMMAIYHGDDAGNSGYRHTDGYEARDGLTGYYETIQNELDSSLAALSPAARQKAIGSLMSVNDSYRKLAATHAVDAGKKIEADLIVNERSQIEEEAYNNPLNLAPTIVTDQNGKKVSKASDLKIRYGSTFKTGDLKDAIKGWEGMIVGVGEKIYNSNATKVVTKEDGEKELVIGSGLEDLKVYYDTIAKGELSASSQEDFIEKVIAKHQKEETKLQNDFEKSWEVRFTRLETRKKSINSSTEFAKLYGNKEAPITPTEMYVKASKGLVTESSANVYRTAYESINKGDKVVTDIEDYTFLLNAINETSDVNYVVGDVDVAELVNSYGTLSITDRKSLANKVITNIGSREKDQLKDVSRSLKALIPPIYDAWNNPTDEENVLWIKGEKEYSDLRAGGATHEDALFKVETKYGNPDLIFTMLPSILGEKPKTAAAYSNIVKKLRTFKASGQIDANEYNKAVQDLGHYKSILTGRLNKGNK